MSSLRRTKIFKADPSALEVQICQALVDLELNVADLSAELRPLHISSAKEVRFFYF